MIIIRQERNRDAAVRSRERKKLYVKDLEMKSRYFEGECKRLGMLLNCVVAENQALRLSLHSTKAFGASMTKQESAVLLLGMNQQNYPCLFLLILLIFRLQFYEFINPIIVFLLLGVNFYHLNQLAQFVTNQGQESLLLLQELRFFLHVKLLICQDLGGAVTFSRSLST